MLGVVIHKVCNLHFEINQETHFNVCFLAASQSSTTSNSRPAQQQRPGPTQSQTSVVEDAEDTMKNLRKTFAGIFGDM